MTEQQAMNLQLKSVEEEVIGAIWSNRWLERCSLP
jgi:hypothetical protein